VKSHYRTSRSTHRTHLHSPQTREQHPTPDLMLPLFAGKWNKGRCQSTSLTLVLVRIVVVAVFCVPSSHACSISSLSVLYVSIGRERAGQGQLLSFTF
jgi:hypothetical protein